MKSNNRAEAHKLHRAELPITLCPPDGKKPLGDGWDGQQNGLAWQKKKWTLKEIDRAFELRGELNVGVLYGPRSGLIDIEGDSAGAEAAILELFGGEPPIAPMFRSRRGLHRIMRFDADLNAVGKASVHWPDPGRGPLEIKLGASGKASHSLWPPSTANGIQREWVEGLMYDECDAPSLPTAVKETLLQSHRKAQGTVNTETQAIACVSVCLCKPVDEAIAKAIGATIPTGPGFRHRQLFHFARLLKAIPSLADADLQTLRPIVERWHQQALPRIRTKYFTETWVDFSNAWSNVKFPAGCGPIQGIFQTAISRPIPTVALNYEVPEIRSLIALCRELQHISGAAPFFLSCRTAGELLNISYVLANKWLRLLVRDKVLVVVRVGVRRRASEYRYVDD